MTKAIAALALAVILVVAWEQGGIASPEIPGSDPGKPVALVGGTIHPVTGPVIERGRIVFDQGKITAIGRKVKVPAGAKRLDVIGRHVYPGLINAYSQLGLVEIRAVRATLDHNEVGQLNPNVKAEVAFNPDSELIPVTRSGGVLVALAAPTGGRISGTSALMKLDGWTWEEMTLRAPVGMHVEWPRMPPAITWPESSGQQHDGTLASLDKIFADAAAYRTARMTTEAVRDSQPSDLRLEAMLPVIEGRLPLIVSANGLQTIQAAVAFAQRQQVKLIILGGYDAPRCAELLRNHQIPVIVSTTHRTPRRRGDPYDAAYSLPERLRAAGIRFCVAARNTSNARNLPYEAATAVAYGLPKDEALKAITLYPAQILGVADRVGSLEVGKDATLIVTDGDPLETATQVRAAFIEGRAVDLSDRHKRLWLKYREKYRPTAR
jgi:imidazolonepropionase-like amidohydrolase